MSFPKSIVPVAVVALILLASCYANPTPVQKPIEPVQTIQRYNLKGTVFADWNGDGIQEKDEPGIPNVVLNIQATARSTATSDLNGNFEMDNLPVGDYLLTIGSNPVGTNGQKFKYISLSNAEFKEIYGGAVKVRINGNTEANVGLMQGFETFPFAEGTKFTIDKPFGIAYYLDLDNRQGEFISWDGVSQTYDGHTGFDVCVPIGTEVRAMAPGKIIKVGWTDDNPGKGLSVFEEVLQPYGNYLMLAIEYAHLSEVDDKIKTGYVIGRGEGIGRSGRTPAVAWLPNIPVTENFAPHLHVSNLLAYSLNPFKAYSMDSYRTLDIAIKNDPSIYVFKYSLWTKDNDPQYPNVDNLHN